MILMPLCQRVSGAVIHERIVRHAYFLVVVYEPKQTIWPSADHSAGPSQYHLVECHECLGNPHQTADWQTSVTIDGDWSHFSATSQWYQSDWRFFGACLGRGTI